MIYFLAALCAFLYWLGGEGKYWYRDLVIRRAGCTLCIVTILWITCGWNKSIVIMALALYGSFTIGDFGKFFWTPQALAVTISCLIYSYFIGHIWALCPLLAIIPALVYVVSRFFQPFDMALRGAIYGVIPLIFFWVKLHG